MGKGLCRFVIFTSKNFSAVASAGGSSASDDCVSSTVDSFWTTSNDALELLDSPLTDSVLVKSSCTDSLEACAVFGE
jgi:hypothetical protein